MPVPEPTRFPIETRFQSALNAIRNPGFIKSPKYQQQQKRALREGAHPDILDFERKLVKRLASMGVPVFAVCVVRTAQEQAAVYASGASKDSPDDGLWPHMAFAVDIIHGTLGYMDRPLIPNAWAIIVHVAKEVAISMGIEITCGHDWGWDSAHFELKHWKRIAREGDKKWHPTIKL